MADLCECLFPFFGSHRINEEEFYNQTRARMESRGHITNPSTGVAEATVIIKQTDVIHVPQAYAVSISVPPPSAPLKATVSSTPGVSGISGQPVGL
mgnify:CR=1 FL=1